MSNNSEFYGFPRASWRGSTSDLFLRIPSEDTNKCRMSLSASRQQFLAYETHEAEEMKYKRRGGIFITKCICFGFVVAALVLAALVGAIVYYVTCCMVLNSLNADIWDSQDPFSLNSKNSQNLRLPNTVIPSFYRLKLNPLLEQATFSGEVSITLRTNSHNIKQIILHAKDLDIDKSVLLTELNYEKLETNQKTGRVKREAQNDELKTGSAPSLETNVNNTNGAGHAIQLSVNSTSNESQPKIDNPPSLDPNNSTQSNLTEKPSENNATAQPEPSSLADKPAEPHINKNATEIEKSEAHETNSRESKSFPSNTEPNNIHSDISIKNIEKETQVTHSNVRKINVVSMILEKDTDRLTLNLESALKPGIDYILQLNFDGNITDSLTGFYRSTYLDDDKQTRELAVTQFEPTSARSAFPCFDEPEFKAKFEISISHRNNMTVLSNMKVTDEEDMVEQPGYKWTHFERSIKMSTYLVAYVLCNFQAKETSYFSKDNITKAVKVWARPELLENANYAIDITPKLLKYYEDMFGVPYALDKLDLIAIPDFASGAMENWGLITFRETTLLYSSKDKVARDKQSVAIDVSHELAHQWFGNLVTMKWWTDLWLNEGFATYTEYVGVNHIEPEWNVLEGFTKDKMELLRLDALKNTSPVSSVVNDASEISQKFDEISYAKGASLIRMLNHTITEELFRKGLVYYLNKWKFTNAEENDLWAAMSDANKNEGLLKDISIVKFMNSWTKQAGYPVVTAERNYNSSKVTFTQKLFTTATKPYKWIKDQIWQIPISHTSLDVPVTEWKTTPKTWLKERTSIVELSMESSQALYVNVGGIGYYRVNYDSKNWQLLNHYLKNGKIPSPTTRAQLLDDAFNLAKVSLLEYHYPLDLSTYLIDGEDSRTVWELFLSNLSFLKFNLKNSPYYRYFQDYVQKIITKQLEKLEYGLNPPKNDSEAFLIENLLSWECKVEAPRCISWARQQFNNWRESNNTLDNPIRSYLRPLVYSTALRFGGRSEFDFLWDVFQNTSDPNIQSTIINSLSNTRDESLIILLLERSLKEIPNQYAPSVWSFDSTIGSKVAQEFLISNWHIVHAKFSKMDTFLFPAVLTGAFSSIATDEEFDKFKSFVEKHKDDLKPVFQTVRKMADSTELRLEWLKRHLHAVETWLRTFSGETIETDKIPNAANTSIQSNVTNESNRTEPTIAGNSTEKNNFTVNINKESTNNTSEVTSTPETPKQPEPEVKKEIPVDEAKKGSLIDEPKKDGPVDDSKNQNNTSHSPIHEVTQNNTQEGESQKNPIDSNRRV